MKLRPASTIILKIASVFLTCTLLGGAGAPAFAVSSERALNTLGQINTYSPMEAAHSLGSIGFSFGLGWQSRIFDHGALSQWGNPEEFEQLKGEALVNAYLTKGFRWPFDFGVVASQVPGTTIQRVGGHLQYTLFQGFRLPSLASRFSFTRLSGFQQTALASSQLGLVADYSFLRYFTLFTSYNALFHRATYYNYIANWSLAEELSPARQSDTWWDQHHSFGLKVKLFSPYLSFTAEHQQIQSGQKQWLGKFSIGM